MNLQDISIEQITMFCNMFNCSLEEFKPSHNDSYYLKMFTGSMGPQPEFRVTETSCKGINYYKGYDLTIQWLKFLDKIEKSNTNNL